jgi:hypothetical protein
MATTYSGTISTISPGGKPGLYYASVGPLNATAFIQINDLDAVDSLIVSWVDPVTISLVGSATNSIVVPGSITIDTVENNTGLWPLVSTSGLTIFGRFGQQFSIYYG